MNWILRWAMVACCYLSAGLMAKEGETRREERIENVFNRLDSLNKMQLCQYREALIKLDSSKMANERLIADMKAHPFVEVGPKVVKMTVYKMVCPVPFHDSIILSGPIRIDRKTSVITVPITNTNKDVKLNNSELTDSLHLGKESIYSKPTNNEIR